LAPVRNPAHDPLAPKMAARLSRTIVGVQSKGYGTRWTRTA
jgi:hypothetical protein